MKRDLPLASPALPRIAVGTAWRNALPPLAVALVAIVAAYFGTASEIVGTWMRSQTYAHGFVVVPIALWLVYRMRARLALLAPRPWWPAILLLACAAFAWLLGVLGAVNALAQAAFVAMLVLSVPAILGPEVGLALMFPLGFLFFAVPIGDFLLPTLMEWTADFTIRALRASGVPVYREGLQFVIPTGRWSIIEACSGVRYLIASLLTGTLFAYVTYRSNWRRVAFAGVAIAVPVLANWLRAYMIVMIGYLSNNALATGIDHVLYGWLFFGIVMVLLFWIGARWQEAPAPPGGNTTLVTNPSANALRPFAGASVSAMAQWRLVAALLVVTMAWPLVVSATRSHGSGTPALGSLDVPGWTASMVAAAGPQFAPHFKAPSAVLQQTLQRDGMAVDLYVAYYRNQNFERKLVSSENVLVHSMKSPWVPVASRLRTVTLGSSRHDVVATVLRGPRGERIDAWKWYWIDGGIASSDAIAKARIALERLRGHGDDGAAVVVYAMSEDGADSTPLLERFVRDAWPGIEATLRKAGGTP